MPVAPRSVLVLTAVMAIAVVPASAAAKGGGQPAPAPAPQPAPAATPCATLISDVAPQVRSGGGDKPISLSWTVANCSSASETLTVSATPTTTRVEGNTVVNCTGAPFTAGTVTLKPGAKQSLKVDAPKGPCYVPSSALNVVYNAVATDASGARLATASNMLTFTFRP
jgi:hypothetical protein